MPSFSTTGATPNKPIDFSAINFPQASTPQSKALSGALASSKPATPTPSTPVKSVTSPDGTKTEYHPPQQSGLLSNTSPTGNTTALPGQSQGVLNQQGGTSATTPPTFQGLLSTVAQQGSQPSAIQQQATDQSKQAFGGTQDYIKQLEQNRAEEATALKEVAGQPIPLGDITGQQQAASSYYAQKQAALGSAAQAESSLYSPALSGATTAQGQQFGASQAAASHAQPQLGAFGQGYYNPLDPNSGAGGPNSGALNPLNNVDSLAQQILNGQISPAQANAMGGSVPNFQGVLNQAILKANPKANLAQLQGSYDARQSNTTTAGTAATNAAAAAYGQFFGPSLSVGQQLANVEGLGNLLVTTATGSQINPFAPQFANQTIGQLRSQLSDEGQARFNSTLAAFQGAASTLLANSSGQIPTDISANIAAISNGNLSLGALKAMVDQAQQEGRIKAQNAQTPLHVTGAQLGFTPPSTIGSTQNSGTTPSGISYTIH